MNVISGQTPGLLFSNWSVSHSDKLGNLPFRLDVNDCIEHTFCGYAPGNSWSAKPLVFSA